MRRPCPWCGSGPVVHGIFGTLCGNCEWQPYDEVPTPETGDRLGGTHPPRREGAPVCESGDTTPVWVKIPADLSSTGAEKWRECKIDACIATLVEALQAAGVDMRGSCCGHGKCEGDIHLQDGRALLILSREDADRYYRDKRAPGETKEGDDRMARALEEARKRVQPMVDRMKKAEGGMSAEAQAMRFRDA